MKKMTAYQSLTGSGRLGATFFVISPLIFWGALVVAIPGLSGLIMVLSLIIFLLSVVLMFVGRRLDIQFDG